MNVAFNVGSVQKNDKEVTSRASSKQLALAEKTSAAVRTFFGK